LNDNALTKERIARMVQTMPALLGTLQGKITQNLSGEYSDVQWNAVLQDYYRVMEIAHYIRRGGVKAMIYRIETGRTTIAPGDYFDQAHVNLSASFRKLAICEVNNQSVLQRLVAVTSEEEELVRDFLPEIDQLLLSVKRKEAALSED